MKILLLEDDKDLSETLGEFLELQGFSVDLAQSYNEALDLSFTNKYDLYLFDINLPKESGLELARELIEASDDTPIIFITALTDIQTITNAFNIGAVDYIKKPFFPEELLLRIQQKFKKNDTLRYKNIEIDGDILKVDGKVTDIGHNQFVLLKELLQNIGKPVTKERLLELLDTPSDGALRVALNRLKKRFSLPIQNIRSKGYMIEKV